MCIPRWIHRRVPNLVPIGPAVWQLSQTCICDPTTPTPEMPPGVLRGELYLAYVHYQTNPQTCIKFGANRSSRLTTSLDFWICDPITPPPPGMPPGVRGKLYLAYVHSQTRPPTCTTFGANRCCRLTASPYCWIWILKKPQMPPVLLRGDLI